MAQRGKPVLINSIASPEPDRARETPAQEAPRALALSAWTALRAPELEFFNGLGGFAARWTRICDDPRAGPIDARALDQRHRQSGFGFQTATEGGGYTWSVNSRENQLTPWSNDPVSDRPGEVFYLRDDDTGELWSPTALPIRDPAATYVARHGRGYSRFEHAAHGIAADLAAVRAGRWIDQDFAPRG